MAMKEDYLSVENDPFAVLLYFFCDGKDAKVCVKKPAVNVAFPCQIAPNFPYLSIKPLLQRCRAIDAGYRSVTTAA